MISVLIPIYNVVAIPLVSILHKQLSESQKPFEIFCVDDASALPIKSANRVITGFSNVRYEELERNMGRARIRHYLAGKATFETLLMLDCDVIPVSDKFISNYLSLPANSVCNGGIVYSEKPPDKSRHLRWKYGKYREELSPEKRRLKKVFLASNLLIPKQIFLKNEVNAVLLGYGHEDTLMGIQLQKAGIQVSQMDNPAEHQGLDESIVFLKKTDNALANLAQLWKQGLFGKSDVLLLRYYFILHNLGIIQILTSRFLNMESSLTDHLIHRQPNLLKFDLWRLLRLHVYLTERAA